MLQIPREVLFAVHACYNSAVVAACCMCLHTEPSLRKLNMRDGSRMMRSTTCPQEEPTEVTDEEALPVLLEALRNSAGGLPAVLKGPDYALAFMQRVTWLRTFCREAVRQGTPHQGASQTASSTTEGEEHGSAVLNMTSEQGRDAELERKLQAAAALPDLSNAALAADVESWLVPRLRGLRSLAQVQSLDWSAIFR